MKNLNLFSLLLFSLAFAVSSCKEKKEDPKPVNNPFVLEDINTKTILEDKFEDPNLPDYLVNDRISVNAELIVKPGVVIAFAEDVYMEVNSGGSLIAKGEPAKKIRFTGKLNRNGYWGGIIFYSESSNNEISNAEVLYAGSVTLLSDVKAGIAVTDQARLTLKSTTVAFNGGYGIFLNYGAILYGFANNTISNNAVAPILLAAEHVSKLDAASSYSNGNGINAIEVMRSFLEGNGEIAWPAFNDNTPYRFTGQITVHAGWKLSPGTTIEVIEDEYIEIAEGYLNAVGTADKKITFTGVVKSVGTWNGIVIYPRSAFNKLEHVQVQYAGGDGLINDVKTSIVISSNASLVIKNSKISHSGGYGIHVVGTEPTLNADAETANTFTSNILEPIFFDR